jgi:putative DNA primase/helicase
MKSMMETASMMPGVPVREDALDPMPNILNCRNVCVDLKTGEIVDAKASWLLSKRTAVDFDREASCPTFMRFVDEIMVGRQDMVEFLQRWFGYCLTGEMTAQVFTIFYGNGANGKSTLVELISRIMGSYSRTAPPDTFVQKQAGGIPNDVAALRGSRLVLTTETEANSRLAESKIKNLTGGDRVSARFMRAEYFEFQPTWKIVISTNHRPRVSGADHGIWRRIVLVPFDFIATKDRMDPLLPKKLWEERDGILRWMVQGAAKWYADGEGRAGLNISKNIMDEVEEYKSDEDLIGRYIDEECVKGQEITQRCAPVSIRTRDMHNAFTTFAAEVGEKYAASMSMNMFSRAMRERGYEPVRKTDGVKFFTMIYPKALLGVHGNYNGGSSE